MRARDLRAQRLAKQEAKRIAALFDSEPLPDDDEMREFGDDRSAIDAAKKALDDEIAAAGGIDAWRAAGRVITYPLSVLDEEEDTHSCGYHCERPECIRAQRDELVQRFVEDDQAN